MRTRVRVWVFGAVLVVVGCGDTNQADEDETSGEETGGEVSAIPGCGPADGPTVLLAETDACSVSPEAVGFQILFEAAAVPMTYDVLDWPYGYCRMCDQTGCEDATACVVEVTEVSDTQIVADIDASFPSGPLLRTVEAQLCPQEFPCG